MSPQRLETGFPEERCYVPILESTIDCSTRVGYFLYFSAYRFSRV
jgi:hypothetical protein